VLISALEVVAKWSIVDDLKVDFFLLELVIIMYLVASSKIHVTTVECRQYSTDLFSYIQKKIQYRVPKVTVINLLN